MIGASCASTRGMCAQHHHTGHKTRNTCNAQLCGLAASQHSQRTDKYTSSSGLPNPTFPVYRYRSRREKVCKHLHQNRHTNIRNITSQTTNEAGAANMDTAQVRTFSDTSGSGMLNKASSSPSSSSSAASDMCVSAVSSAISTSLPPPPKAAEEEEEGKEHLRSGRSAGHRKPTMARWAWTCMPCGPTCARNAQATKNEERGTRNTTKRESPQHTPNRQPNTARIKSKQAERQRWVCVREKGVGVQNTMKTSDDNCLREVMNRHAAPHAPQRSSPQTLRSRSSHTSPTVGAHVDPHATRRRGQHHNNKGREVGVWGATSR